MVLACNSCCTQSDTLSPDGPDAVEVAANVSEDTLTFPPPAAEPWEADKREAREVGGEPSAETAAAVDAGGAAWEEQPTARVSEEPFDGEGPRHSHSTLRCEVEGCASHSVEVVLSRCSSASSRPSASSTTSQGSARGMTWHDRLNTKLWVLAVCSLVVVVCSCWALLADYGCEGDDKRNVFWFAWVWDMAYVFIGVMTALTVADTCYLNACVSNWRNRFRCRIYTLAVVISMACCVAQKVALSALSLYKTSVGWFVVKLVIIITCSVTTVVILLSVLWYTPSREEKWFAAGLWFFYFLVIVWALLFYICNQLFVHAYQAGHDVLENLDASVHVVGIYDYTTACFFSALYVPCWGAVGHRITRKIRHLAPPVLKDRVHLLIMIWVELFNTCFGRIVLGEVEVEAVVLIFAVKDSIMRCLDLGFKYMPSRLISLAMVQEDDTTSSWFKVLNNMFWLCLDLDLRLMMECCLCGRTDHMHPHHLPDSAFTAEEVARAASVHRNHISRAHWREYGCESRPEPPAAVTEDDVTEDDVSCVLHWSSAMHRSAHRKETLVKKLHRVPTHLDGGMRAISNARDSRSEMEQQSPTSEASGLSDLITAEVSTRALYLRSFWRSLCCTRSGVTRKQVKGYLKWAWGCEHWSALENLEAEALCDRICFVQRNLRMKFVGVCLPRITSSLIGIIHLYLRRYFPCACSSLDLPKSPEPEEIRLWWLLLIGDIVEITYITWIHMRQQMEQKEHSSWRWLQHVLGDPWFMLSVAFLSMHIVQDSYLSFWTAEF